MTPEDQQDFAELYARLLIYRARPGFDSRLFAFSRNGLRMAIASIEDETGELYDEWRDHKRQLGNAVREVRHELLDIAACAMIAYGETFAEERT